MTTVELARRRRISTPVMWAVAGFGTVVLFFLALLLPGQNIHGGTLTGVTYLFGLSVPPLCFAVGLLTAVLKRIQVGNLGIWLNSAGLVLYALWVSGVLGKILDRV